MKILMSSILCLCLFSISAFAEHSNLPLSANIALSSDYMYRGQSQTGNLPSISGGLDYEYGSLYAGIWASNVDFGNNVTQEVDLYTGYIGSLGKVSYDAGILYYLYPGQPDGSDFNFVEGSVGLGYNLTEKIYLGVTGRYTPDWQGSTGRGINVEGDVTFAIGSGISLSAAAGKQTVDENTAWGTPDWIYYSVGVTKSLGPLDVTASWVDSDLSLSECFAGSNICEGRAMLSVSSSW